MGLGHAMLEGVARVWPVLWRVNEGPPEY